MYSLPFSYLTFRDAILCSHVTLILDEAYDALFSKEKINKLVVGFKPQAEGLAIHEKSLERNSGDEDRSMSKSTKKNNDCGRIGLCSS